MHCICTAYAPTSSPPPFPEPVPVPNPVPEAEQVRGSFEAYDTSGAGRLSPADAEVALGAVGLQLAPGQLTQLLQLHGGAGSAQSDTVTLDDALGVLALILEG
eukprot:scaffold8191_cov67-Phaeocystis_antarctica.AAC.2